MNSILLSKTYITTTLLIIALSGCGGSSGGDTNPVPNENKYDLLTLSTESVSFSLSGSDSSSNNYIATFTRTNLGDDSLNGTAVTKMSIYTSIKNTSSNTTNVNTTTVYIDGNGNKSEAISEDGNICTLSNSPTSMPTNASVGDAGEMALYECTDGTSFKEYWHLEDAGNGNANYIMTTEDYDTAGALDETDVETVLIDADGQALSYKIVGTWDNGSLTLSGPSN